MSDIIKKLSKPVSRRNFVAGSAAAAGVAGMPRVFRGSDALAAVNRQSPTPKSGGTLIIGMEAEISSFDPAAMQGTSTFRPVSSIFDPLVNLFGSSSEIAPDLAMSWEVSPDVTSVTMKLRPGVKFQDGTDFNANAVVFSFERMLNTSSPDYYGPYAFPSFFYPNYKLATAVDPMTVRFDLKQPDATFLSALVWNTGSIVSPTAAKAAGKDFPNKPVGAGPFNFVSWEKDVKTTMSKFDGYWGGAPYLDTLIWIPIVEEAERFNQLTSGEVDFIVSIDPQFVPAVQANPDLQLIQTPSLQTWWVYLNMHEPHLKDLRVRQAMNYAINKDSLIKNVLKDTAVVSTGWSWPNTWSYNPNVTNYAYDPQKAKDLLTAAGYPDGFDIDYFVPESGSGMVAPKEIATAMQADLKAVGINVNITTQEWISYITTVEQGLDNINGKQFGLAQLSWLNPVADPGLFVEYISAGQGDQMGLNLGYYDNADYNALLAHARTVSDQATRASDYQQAQKIFADDAPWIFMFCSNFVTAANKSVQGLVLNPDTNVLHLKDVWKDS
jgi:peptide/nickel transport system substrate-binding protein